MGTILTTTYILPGQMEVVLVCLSVAVKKHSDQKRLGRERVCLASLKEAKEERMQRPQRDAAYWLASPSLLSYFFFNAAPVHLPRYAPPTVGGPSSINQQPRKTPHKHVSTLRGNSLVHSPPSQIHQRLTSTVTTVLHTGNTAE